MRLDVTRQEVVHPGRPGESSGCQVITHPDQEAWMNIHKNARLTPYRRQELVARVERGEPVTAVARAFGVSRQTARKWVVRKRDAGVVDSTAWAGDGSSRPDHSPRQTEPKIQLAIKVLRWQRWTCRQIAGALAIDTSTAIWRHVQRCQRRDRKSTRLNSSHLVISYAVFCLKKKKK